MLRHKHLIKVRSFSNVKIGCMSDHVKPTIRNDKPHCIVLHAGTNELQFKSKTPIQICNELINLQAPIKEHGIKVAISCIVSRNDEYNDKVTLV